MQGYYATRPFNNINLGCELAIYGTGNEKGYLGLQPKEAAITFLVCKAWNEISNYKSSQAQNYWREKACYQFNLHPNEHMNVIWKNVFILESNKIDAIADECAILFRSIDILGEEFQNECEKLFNLLDPLNEILLKTDANRRAQWYLAECMNKGYGFDINAKEGFKYMKLAADQGLAPAFNGMAEYYEDNLIKAGKYHRLSVQISEEDKAQYPEAGFVIDEAENTLKEATRLYRKAYNLISSDEEDQESAQAKYELAYDFEEQGDFIKACKYYRKEIVNMKNKDIDSQDSEDDEYTVDKLIISADNTLTKAILLFINAYNALPLRGL